METEEDKKSNETPKVIPDSSSPVNGQKIMMSTDPSTSSQLGHHDSPTSATKEKPELTNKKFQGEKVHLKLFPNFEQNEVILNDTADQLLDHILFNLSKAVGAADLRNGFVGYVKRMHLYIDMFGFRFTKETHVNLIGILMEIMTQLGSRVELPLFVLENVASLLQRLLRKQHLLTRSDLSIAWRPLWTCLEKLSRQAHAGNNDVLRRKENAIRQVIPFCSLYFPRESFQEICSAFLPFLCPFSTKMRSGFDLHTMFLPFQNVTDCHPESVQLVQNLLKNYLDPWNHGSAFKVNLMRLVSVAAWNLTGKFNWDPFLPSMYAHFIKSLKLPVHFKGKRAHTSKHASFDAHSIAKWIVSTLGNNEESLKYLKNFLAPLETYYIPANTGTYTSTLINLNLELIQQFTMRLTRERYQADKYWWMETREDQKLTENDIDVVVELVSRPVLDFYLDYSGAILKYAALLRPQMIIPTVIDKYYRMMESVTEFPKYLVTLGWLEPLIPLIVCDHSDDQSDDQNVRLIGQNYDGRDLVIPLAFSLLPALDVNDSLKTIEAFRIISSILKHVKIVDCASIAFPELEKTEMNEMGDNSKMKRRQRLCAETRNFEDFVDQFLDRTFALIENLVDEHTRMTDVKGPQSMNFDQLVSSIYVNFAFRYLSANCSAAIAKTAVEKLASFILTKAFETEVASGLYGHICTGFAKSHPTILLPKLLPTLVHSITQLISEDQDDRHLWESENDEDLDHTLAFHLSLFASILHTSGLELIKYKTEVNSVIWASLKLNCKRGYTMASIILSTVIQNLVQVYTLRVQDDQKFPADDDRDLEKEPNYVAVDDWGKSLAVKDTKIHWHVPTPEELEWVREICVEIFAKFSTPLVRQMEEKLMESTSSSAVGLSKNFILKRLKILQAAYTPIAFLLPPWDASQVIPRDSVVVYNFFEKIKKKYGQLPPFLPFFELTLPSQDDPTDFEGSKCTQNLLGGQNVRKAYFEILLKVKVHLDKFMPDATEVYGAMVEDGGTLGHQLLDGILEKFEDGVPHQELKAALYILWHGHKGYQNLMNSWEDVRLIWMGLLKCPVSEKASIIKAINSIKSHMVDQFDIFPFQWPPKLETATETNSEAENGLETISVSATCEKLAKILIHSNHSLDEENEQKMEAEFENTATAPFVEAPNLTADESAQEQNAQRCHNDQISYNKLVDQLLEFGEDSNKHWRKQLLCAHMLSALTVRNCQPWIHPRVVKFFFNALVSPFVDIRVMARNNVNYMLKSYRRNYPKMKLNTATGIELMDGQTIHSILQYRTQKEAGNGRCTLKFENDDTDLTPEMAAAVTSESSELILHQNHLGYSGLPAQLEIPVCPQNLFDQVVAEFEKEEGDEKICENRQNDQSNESQVWRITLEFFEDPGFLKKLLALWCLEEKKDGAMDLNIIRILRMVTNNNGPRGLTQILDQLGPMANDKDQWKQRCILNILAGILSGMYKWSEDMCVTFWEGQVKPILTTCFDNATEETFPSCNRMVEHATHRNQNKLRFLVNYFLDRCIKSLETIDATSVKAVHNMNYLCTIMANSGWRGRNLALQVSQMACRHFTLIPVPYKNVRGKLGRMVNGIFSRNQDATMADSGTDLDDPCSEFIAAILETNKNICEEAQNFQMHSTSEENNEVQNSLFKFKTFLEMIRYTTLHMRLSFPPKLYGFIQWLCHFESYDQDPEVAQLALQTLSGLSKRLVRPEDMDKLLDSLTETVTSSCVSLSLLTSWRSRLCVLEFLKSFSLTNSSILISNAGWCGRVIALVLQLLIHDEKMEVQETASKVFSGFVHYRLVSQERVVEILKTFKTDALYHKRVKKMTATVASSFGLDSQEATVVAVGRARGAILGICSIVDAHPYSVPDYLPPILIFLTTLLHDPHPIPTIIHKCLTKFRQTHHANWDTAHKPKFSEDQLSILMDILAPASYFV